MSLSKKKHIIKSNILLESRFLNEDLRNYALSYGWSSSLLGNINSDLENLVSTLISSAKTQYNCVGRITAGQSDTYKNNKESKHNSGKAVDIEVNDACKSNILNLLNTFSQNSNYYGMFYSDEYSNPNKGSATGHIHISFDKNNPETSSSDFPSPSTSGGGSTGGSSTTSTSGSSSGSGSTVDVKRILTGMLGGKS